MVSYKRPAYRSYPKILMMTTEESFKGTPHFVVIPIELKTDLIQEYINEELELHADESIKVSIKYKNRLMETLKKNGFFTEES